MVHRSYHLVWYYWYRFFGDTIPYSCGSSARHCLWCINWSCVHCTFVLCCLTTICLWVLLAFHPCRIILIYNKTHPRIWVWLIDFWFRSIFWFKKLWAFHLARIHLKKGSCTKCLLNVNRANALVPHIAFPVMSACLVHSLIWCLLLGFRLWPPIQANCCHLINRGKPNHSQFPMGWLKSDPVHGFKKPCGIQYTVYRVSCNCSNKSSKINAHHNHPLSTINNPNPS